jgi:hypothetical protein
LTLSGAYAAAAHTTKPSNHPASLSNIRSRMTRDLKYRIFSWDVVVEPVTPRKETFLFIWFVPPFLSRFVSLTL